MSSCPGGHLSTTTARFKLKPLEVSKNMIFKNLQMPHAHTVHINVFAPQFFLTFESLHTVYVGVYVCVKNKQKKLWVCAVLLVYFFNTLKSIKWPSVERASALPITPLPAAPLDSDQCAKQLWKRPHAFSLIECPLRNVFPTLPIFIRSIEIPTHFCHVRLVPLQVWHDGAHLDWVRVGHPVEIEWTGISLLNR